eukprot:TRINITY_DN51608_c0_g1_i1.p1 TRINITY_DN51608_c0_g1~~TRINITY_DN51608_c0_g1_i1.p1  ORF type:complete len:526 (+),score=101.66 TRINITY_DN51608_c0_g1_i1:56-1579(+)
MGGKSKAAAAAAKVNAAPSSSGISRGAVVGAGAVAILAVLFVGVQRYNDTSGPAVKDEGTAQPPPRSLLATWTASMQCLDQDNECYNWALKKNGSCDEQNAASADVRWRCPRSCGACQPSAAEPTTLTASFPIAFEHKLEDVGDLSIYHAPEARGEPQEVGVLRLGQSLVVQAALGQLFLVKAKLTGKVLGEVRTFPIMKRLVIDKHWLEALSSCKDFVDMCAKWPKSRVVPECMKNPGWMIPHCAKSCDACQLLDGKERCKRMNMPMNQTPVLQPGDIDALFRSIPQDWPQYNATIVSTSPWIITFDKVVQEDELDAILRHSPNLKRSTTQTDGFDERGIQKQDVQESRTSENAWCQGACAADPLVRRLTQRISDIVRVPVGNFEQFQVLRYTKGQKYDAHNDMTITDIRQPAGPRIFTFFMYFSDVEEGGETAFPNSADKIKVRPKRGSAVLWPSVLDDNPTLQDNRAVHQAVAVEKGVKYAANSWIHLHNYHVPQQYGCVGSFS